MLLLTNLSQDEEACRRLVALGDEALLPLVERFAGEGAPRGGGAADEDQIEHLGSVFMNVARTREGRDAMTSDSVDAPRRLAAVLRSGNTVRRRGVAATLKNICMDEEGAPDALLHEAVLAAILRSLGADKPMHPADDDEAVRILLSEAVHLIVRSDEGLDALWAMQVAPKLQMCYQHEKNAEVCDTYERIAAVILEAGRDAGGEGTGEGGDAEIEVEMRPGFAAIDER